MQPFRYLTKYRILVCCLCGYGCVTGEVGIHLRTKHHDILIADRRRRIDIAQQIKTAIRNQDQLIAFRFPRPSTAPIPILQPPRLDGLRCRSCECIVCDGRAIRAHCREVLGTLKIEVGQGLT